VAAAAMVPAAATMVPAAAVMPATSMAASAM
jgi:hypothetical protein